LVILVALLLTLAVLRVAARATRAARRPPTTRNAPRGEYSDFGPLMKMLDGTWFASRRRRKL
jgi:hypothetical protein